MTTRWSVAAPLLLTLLAGGLVLAGLAVWWGPPRPSSSPPPAGATLVFLGDSITSGHGLPLAETFPHRLGRTLGLPVRNAGISGDTTDGGLARLEADVLSATPTLVVVELGVNDVFTGQPRARTVENLRTITRRLRARGVEVVLIHIRLPRVAGDGYRDDLRAIAAAEGAHLVEDFLEDVVPGLTTDGLHPDREGHARLAERLLPRLRQLLAR